jgi:hypothetical protein
MLPAAAQRVVLLTTAHMQVDVSHTRKSGLQPLHSQRHQFTGITSCCYCS